jgi:hypothetical protein
MEQLSERLQTPISTAKLQRRWAAVRAAMEREQIDVLLMQNNNDHMAGYVNSPICPRPTVIRSRSSFRATIRGRVLSWVCDKLSDRAKRSPANACTGSLKSSPNWAKGVGNWNRNRAPGTFTLMPITLMRFLSALRTKKSPIAPPCCHHDCALCTGPD